MKLIEQTLPLMYEEYENCLLINNRIIIIEFDDRAVIYIVICIELVRQLNHKQMKIQYPSRSCHLTYSHWVFKNLNH